MTVDSSYNSITRHPTSFLGFLNFLKNSHSLTSFVSLGPMEPGPSTVQPQSHAPPPLNSVHAHVSILHTTIDPPPDNHLAIPLASTALVPRGAMCTTGMAMLGSALQPPRLHATHLHMQYFG